MCEGKRPALHQNLFLPVSLFLWMLFWFSAWHEKPDKSYFGFLLCFSSLHAYPTCSLTFCCPSSCPNQHQGTSISEGTATVALLMWFPDVVLATEATCLFLFRPLSCKALLFVVCAVVKGSAIFLQISLCQRLRGVLRIQVGDRHDFFKRATSTIAKTK